MVYNIDRVRKEFKGGYTYLNRNMIMDKHPDYIYNNLLETCSGDGLFQYPDMSTSYKALSEYLNVDEDCLLITRGVEGAIKQVFETLNLQNCNVGLLTPTFAMYNVYAKVYGARVINVKGKSPNYNINIQDIIKILPDIKVLFLDNPKMHLPNCFTHEELHTILEHSRIHNVIVFLDEIYAGWEYKSFLPNLEKYNNLIISSSFSKIGFPGIKTGWLATNNKLKTKLETTRLSYELDYFSCKALEFLILHQKYFKCLKENIIDKKQQWLKELSCNKIFTAYDSKGFNLRLYSDDSKKIKQAYNNLYAKKIITSIVDNNNLVFSVTQNDKVRDIILQEINL
tara:strand:- start:1853 stop:2872 length:1020 start_codon:yes stop_codon:yes gene_type:complete